MQETWVQSLDWEDSPGGRHDNPFWYSCLENPHGQRSLTGYCLWGYKETQLSDEFLEPRTQIHQILFTE